MKQILEILEESARATPEQISTMVGVAVNEVEKTIKKAEEDKIILKYKTIVDWSKLGEKEVWALVEVRVTPQQDVGFAAIAEHIYQFPQVYTAYLVSGTYDLAILVKGKNMHEVSSFVTEKLAPLDKVQSTVTHFLLKRYKDSGEILEPLEEVKRLPITL
ncbi:MAG: Lrp/AsnC family transcriptional regulator [Dehalococcoidia bacterium]|nr:Lrp/AsnC family transcriptional regulator [Dehalococcoidia bacterium]